jgi:hypothetical protein
MAAGMACSSCRRSASEVSNMTSRPKLNEKRVRDHMSRKGARLMQMHTGQGRKWFVEGKDGGEVPDSIAKKIIELPDVRGAADALFPGLDQTWRVIG